MGLMRAWQDSPPHTQDTLPIPQGPAREKETATLKYKSNRDNLAINEPDKNYWRENVEILKGCSKIAE